MKTLFKTLFRFILVLFIFMSFCLVSDASPLINIPPGGGAWEFVKANWAQIALIISEAAALAPGKVKGIIQGVLSIIPFFFNHKNT